MTQADAGGKPHILIVDDIADVVALTKMFLNGCGYQVSTAGSGGIVRQAKKKGVKVTAEATPHHFTLKDEDLKTYDTNMKVNPPLASAGDVQAVKDGLMDGTIDVIATDHAPHLENEKETEFDHAPFGMIGLETALSLSVMGLLDEGYLDWLEQPSVHSMRFENLILEREEALGKLLDYLETRGFTPDCQRTEAVSILEKAIKPKESGTFRKGKPD